MSNLIFSGFSRVFKSKLFYILIVCCSLYPIFMLISEYIYQRQLIYGNSGIEGSLGVEIDVYFLFYLAFIGIASAVFVSVFIGREFSDKTIRNKLVVGHPRSVVYIANLIVCIGACFLIQIASLLLFSVTAAVMRLITGIPYVLLTPASDAVKNQILVFFIIASYTAIFLLISMTAGATSKAVAVSLIAAFILSGSGESVASSVMTTDTMTDMSSELTSLGNGEISIEEYKLSYLEKTEGTRGSNLNGLKRKVYFFLNNILPSCQVEDLFRYNPLLYVAPTYTENYTIYMSPTHTTSYIICDFGMVIATTALGIFIFSKKDLK